MKKFTDSIDDLINDILKLDISNAKKDKLIEKVCNAFDKIDMLEDCQSELRERIEELEEYVYNDGYEMDENVSFKCPYCKQDVYVDMSNYKMDTICPFCKNEVVLEWSNED